MRLGTRSWGVEVPNQTFQAANIVAFGGYVHVNQDNQPVKIGVGSDLSLLHDGSDSFIENITGNLHIRPKAGEEGIKLFPDGSVYLYYNNEIKLTTASWGVSVWGVLQANNLEASNGYVWVKHDNQPVKVGVGGDLSLLHDGTDSKITNITGNLLIEPKSGETGIKIIPDSSVELYHNNVKKAETSADGLNVTNGRLFLYNSTIPHIRLNKTSGDTASTRFILGIATGNDSFITGATQNTCCIKTGGNNMMFGIGTDKKLEINSDGVNLPDNSKLQLGDSQDLKIFHDGTQSIIQDDGTGGLRLRGENTISLASANGNEVYARFIKDGSSELYHDNVKRIETTNEGIAVSGDGQFYGFTSGRNLKWDASEDRLAADDNTKITLGNSQDLQIFHDGSKSVIMDNGTGGLQIKGENTISMGDTTGNRVYLTAIKDGSVSLRHNNATKIETSSSGITVTGSVTTQDMNMSNLNGTANEVDNTKGSWSIQEGADDLFLINRVSGKKYKFNLTEIS